LSPSSCNIWQQQQQQQQQQYDGVRKCAAAKKEQQVAALHHYHLVALILQKSEREAATKGVSDSRRHSNIMVNSSSSSTWAGAWQLPRKQACNKAAVRLRSFVGHNPTKQGAPPLTFLLTHWCGALMNPNALSWWLMARSRGCKIIQTNLHRAHPTARISADSAYDVDSLYTSAQAHKLIKCVNFVS
jgi:hypothetical protein